MARVGAGIMGPRFTSRSMRMSSSDSFIELVARLRDRDEDAASGDLPPLRPAPGRLLAPACRQFDRRDHAGADPEGVVQSADGSFFARVGRSQLEFDGWEQLWGLLVVITLRKCGKRRDTLGAVPRPEAPGCRLGPSRGGGRSPRSHSAGGRHAGGPGPAPCWRASTRPNAGSWS